MSGFFRTALSALVILSVSAGIAGAQPYYTAYPPTAYYYGPPQPYYSPYYGYPAYYGYSPYYNPGTPAPAAFWDPYAAWRPYSDNAGPKASTHGYMGPK
jgi:hypothetical protein